MNEFWNARYKEIDYAYGKEPNTFFKDRIMKYKLGGKILLPAEGEGRNAVYAAGLGLEVFAFDISLEGKKKAMQLAELKNVKLTYEVGNLFTVSLINNKYDCAALIYAHFPPDIRESYHKKISELIMPNGMLVFEGFSKDHINFQKRNPKIGGPKDVNFLFSIEELREDFKDFEVIELIEEEVELNEGKYHIGKGSVIRFIGKKK